MAFGIFRTKSLDAILADADTPEMSLNRALGAGDLMLLGIGAIIGAGIFATIGTAAAGDPNRPGAGPALMVSFVITAIVCSFTALCYAELASMVPISGSAYTYSYATLGEVVAWIIGWDLIIEYAVGNIGVAISWANYFKTFVEGFHNSAGHSYITIPGWITTDYRTAARVIEDNGRSVLDNAPHIAGVPIVFNFLAFAIVALITVILVWGVKESARFNAIMVGIKIVVLLFFIGTGLAYIQADNYHPFAPNGFAGISSGAAIVFFAYIGFDAVSTVAEETRDPQRNLPRGIMGSLIICTIFYIAVAAIFTGLISYTDLGNKLATEQAEPLTMALQHVGDLGIASPRFINIAILVVAFGSVIAHTAVLLVFQLGQPRIFFSMARDGLLPPVFAKIHPKFRTPHITTILTGVFVGGFAGLASLDEMVDLTNIGTLFAFILVCVGVIILRAQDPARPRPFRVPGGWVIPILGVISCIYLIYFLPPTSWLRFAAWLNFGFVIYIAYGAVHSHLTGRALSEDSPAHNAQTAWAGAMLGIIGLVMMFGTLAFDFYIHAKQATSAATSTIEDDTKSIAKVQDAIDEAAKKFIKAQQANDPAAIAAARAGQVAAIGKRVADRAGLAHAYSQRASDRVRAGDAQAQKDAEAAQGAANEALAAANETLAQATAIQGSDLATLTAAAEANQSAAEAYLAVVNAHLDAAEAKRVAAAGRNADPHIEIVTPEATKAAEGAAQATKQAKDASAAAQKIGGSDDDLAEVEKSATLAQNASDEAHDSVTSGRTLAESWWNPSWFLIIPMLLNVLVLFPVIVMRARKVLSDGSGGKTRNHAVLALAVAVILFIGSAVYLVWVVPQKLTPSKTIQTTPIAEMVR